jgi:hypothetical protein
VPVVVLRDDHLGYPRSGGRGGGARGKSACWLTSPMDMPAGWSSSRDSSVYPRETIARQPSARVYSIIVLLRPSGAQMLPKPKYTGGLPASRNAPPRQAPTLVWEDPSARLKHIQVRGRRVDQLPDQLDK